MKHFILTFVTLMLAIPTFAHATLDRVSVSPAVIDEKVLPRDIIKETITVTNTTSSKLDVYAIVNNVDVSSGKQEFLNRADVVLSESLANWISISRAAIELGPGESHDYEVTINTHLNADAGNYHAAISFMWGPSRAYAEENVKYGVSTMVNIEVVENIKERLQLGTFTSKELFFSTPDVSFSYELENIGNKDLTPKGEVRIYDRKGREVASVPANTEGTTIAPLESGQIATAWTATKAFGKYKALLDIEYGSNQLGTVNDTIYFWIVPWKILLVIFSVLATVIGVFVYFWWGRYEQHHEPAYVHAQEKKRFARHSDSLFVDGQIDVPYVSRAPSNDHVMDMRN